MKKFMRISVVFCCLFFVNLNLLADDAGPVSVSEVNISAILTGLNNIPQAINTTYNTLLVFFTDLLSSTRGSMTDFLNQEGALSNATEKAKILLHDAVSNLVSLNLVTSASMQATTNYRLKESAKNDNIAAEDAKTTSYLDNLFKNDVDTSAKTATEPSSAFNVEDFLGPSQYTTEQQEIAGKYVLFLLNLFPPTPVIQLGQKITVPVTFDTELKSLDLAAISSEINNRSTEKKPTNWSGQWEVNSLLEKLLTDSDTTFSDYWYDYHSKAAARSLYISNILAAYQRRLPKTVTIGSSTQTSSPAQLEKDEVYSRLTPTYYDNLIGKNDSDQVTLAKMQRETLILLAQIHRQLYEMKQYEERNLLIQSLYGLQGIGAGTVMAKENLKKVGQQIYCTANNYSGDDDKGNCKKTAGGAPATPSLPM